MVSGRAKPRILITPAARRGVPEMVIGHCVQSFTVMQELLGIGLVDDVPYPRTHQRALDRANDESGRRAALTRMSLLWAGLDLDYIPVQEHVNAVEKVVTRVKW